MKKSGYVVAMLSVVLLAVLSQNVAFSGSKNYKEKGYERLFNGKDLTGWKIPKGDNGHWKVLDGVIDYDARSEAKGNKSLFSKQEFGDFKLHVEWRLKRHSGLYNMPVIMPNGEYARDEEGKVVRFMTPNADSGILIKGAGQANIWCWRVGSGEVWSTRNNKDLPTEERARAVPMFHADNPVGEWNAFDITVKGDRMTVYLNDILVIEDCLMPGMPEKGPIGLQHHGGVVNKETGEMSGASSLIQFRNIWIKEM
jgi:hypothetical protein